jgi:hypothetical protein
MLDQDKEGRGIGPWTENQTSASDKQRPRTDCTWYHLEKLDEQKQRLQ